jgi:hypothetical protein
LRWMTAPKRCTKVAPNDEKFCAEHEEECHMPGL